MIPAPEPDSAPAVIAGGTSSATLDVAGEETLELFRENPAYNEFLVERLIRLSGSPLSGRVLEIGCGIGNITSVLLAKEGVEYLHGVDLDPAYIERVRREIADSRLETTAARAEEFCPERFTAADGQFDTIFCSNVLEHIEDDEGTLRNFAAMLRPGGRALVLVPAHPSLFCGLDENLSHFRRYRRRDFDALAARTELRVVASRYFNPLGALGWWLNGKVLKRRVLPAGQLSAYTRFAIPISRLVDWLNPFPLGVSVLAVLTPR